MCYGIGLFFKITALLRFNLCITKFTPLKCTINWFSVYSENCALSLCFRILMVDIVMELLHTVGFCFVLFCFKGGIETDFKVLSAGVW